MPILNQVVRNSDLAITDQLDFLFAFNVSKATL